MGWMRNENDYIQEHLTKLEEELEVYKKALRLACAQNINNPLCTTETYKACCKSLGSCVECWESMYLQEAREE